MGLRQTWRKPFQVEVSTEHGAPANGNVIDQLSLEISLEHRRVFFFFFFFKCQGEVDKGYQVLVRADREQMDLITGRPTVLSHDEKGVPVSVVRVHTSAAF